MGKTTGGFTLPGESGYEELTLQLAKKWGADVIRDSDGTVLSDDLINAATVFIPQSALSATTMSGRRKTLTSFSRLFYDRAAACDRQ